MRKLAAGIDGLGNRTLCLDASPGEDVVKQVEPPGGDVLLDRVDPEGANFQLPLALSLQTRV